jgi:hypothetical protein
MDFAYDTGIWNVSAWHSPGLLSSLLFPDLTLRAKSQRMILRGLNDQHIAF